MSSPLILTLLAGGATFIGAIFGVIDQKPSSCLLGFPFGFVAGIMPLTSLMEMLPAALTAGGMSSLLGYGMFVIGLLGYFGLDHLLSHVHPQDLVTPATPRPRNLHRIAIPLTLGISLHNFPEGIATYVAASNNLELGMGVALAVALHSIPEGLAAAEPVYAATRSHGKAAFRIGLPGIAEISGDMLAWLILESLALPLVTGAVMAAVTGVMAALSIDEPISLAKEIDPQNNLSYGVLRGMSVTGLSLVVLQMMGIG